MAILIRWAFTVVHIHVVTSCSQQNSSGHESRVDHWLWQGGPALPYVTHYCFPVALGLFLMIEMKTKKTGLIEVNTGLLI